MRFLKRRFFQWPRATSPATLPASAGLAAHWAVVLALAGSPGLLSGQGFNSTHSDAYLVSEVSSIQPGTPFTVAVRFEMDPGWHNYFVNVGDTGLPTEIEWFLPSGWETGEIQWPVPSQYRAGPLLDYVYGDGLALMVEVTPPFDLTPGEAITLAAQVDWLICEALCDPDYAEVSLQLQVSEDPPQLDRQWADLFQTARDRLPKSVPGWSASAEVTEGGYRLSIESADENASLPDSVYFFSYAGEVVEPAAPQVMAVEGNGLSLELTRSTYSTATATTLRGILKAEDGSSWSGDGMVPGLLVEAAVEGAPPVQEAGSEADPTAGNATESSGATLAPGADGFTLTLALVFAFLGGILLNLMPCVFPILSLKILGAASQGGEDRGQVRNQGLLFALGVVLAFLVLAGVLIILRAGGNQLGWGFQLQSPAFVAFMAALFFAIGLNLMGLFEVGATLTRLGGKVGESGSYSESLASGVLATIIATPCTAPFMGAALGFALTRSVPETLLIFGFLGIGMALPYLVLSLAPGLLEKLPKPGPWMETLRHVMAFPMFATVIWLIWVFGQQTGIGGATYLLSALLFVTSAGWMVGRWQRTDKRSGVIARALSLVMWTAAIALVARGAAQEAPLMAVTEGWAPFSQAEVDRTLAQGTPVFLDFTAAWCLTCQVNERVVLNTDAVQQAFEDRNVALFKADWTRYDPEITEALEALGRTGVPVYVLYRGESGSEPNLLPAILTAQIVLDALEEVLSP
ncbi:MAG: thiol:disulfide interchange protein [Gemmatimonadetes bacterium]|nr:thioredoxin family protein [Gemmatimonadota bacterium]NNM06850.1 thiol:disulfide interchange protein [Gemmatimonadota bacterium]